MTKQKFNAGGVVAWVAIAIGAIFMVSLLVYNATHKAPNKHTGGDVWNKAMVEGKMDAPNRMVEYTDYFCSYCADFAEQVNSEKFQEEYIDSGKLRLESRVVTVLAGDHSPNTEQGAEAAFCAADQNKYWEYSADIVPRIKTDFFDKGIGVKTVAVPKPITKLPISYFEESATNADLNVEEFSTCMKNEPNKQTIADNTEKAIRMGITGLPYIVVNDHASGGFQAGWSGMEMLLKAGGVK